MEEQALADFTGGLAAQRASTAFGEGQWSELYGFVLDDGSRLRSQWPLEEVPGPGDLNAMGVYRGHSGTVYLVGVKPDGEIVWRVAPSDDATPGGTVGWTSLSNPDGSTPTDNGGEETRRPVATFPLRQQNQAGYRSGLLFNSVDLATGTSSVLVYENDAGDDLYFIETTEHWPSTDDEGLPKANVAAMWNGVLVLGDVEWIDDPDADFASGNAARHTNGLFFSDVGDPFSWDTLNFTFIADSHVHITGLQPIDSGLLVFTSSSPSGNGGVYLLRGTPPDRYSMVPLRRGVGADTNQTYWEYTGTVCWVTEHGEVWQTDGGEVRRLDWQGLGVDGESQPSDGCVGFGPFLVTSRGGRLFAMRMIDEHEAAAWTELAADPLTSLDMRSAQVSGQSLYLLAGGTVYRYSRAHRSPSIRGQYPDGSYPDLRVSTPTLESGDGHDRTFWRGAGLRATAGSASADEARIVSGAVRAAPALAEAGPWVTTPLNKELMAAEVRSRLQARVRGPGPSVEAAVTFEVRGDVAVEQVSVFYKPGIRSSEETIR